MDKNLWFRLGRVGYLYAPTWKSNLNSTIPSSRHGYVIPAEAGTGSSAMDGTLIARKYLLLDSRLRRNDASLYYETTAPIRGRRVDKRSASTISSSRWMRVAIHPSMRPLKSTPWLIKSSLTAEHPNTPALPEQLPTFGKKYAFGIVAGF
uniref:Uncharacterized protein n=1 Tax=Candidatus Kentrum sp. UNK TaxID=2126344 RepID=A0A451B5G9_9GAMM|nr:MAG: hypothetical protein BECKUNK1418G_GA0071005_12124 [Candidatus Kentron sp. UNK]VFK73538.1 MAG: hypothetical protein BECKUNK1418H_GA0071006_12164 [Candidatus Kentron sp. UNK]